MRNCWLAAIAGRQGNEPSDISPEGPAGAQGTGEIGRPSCGARGPRHSWAAGPGWTTSRSADRRSRRGRLAGGSPTAQPGAQKRACQFFCVWGLEVGGDWVGVGGGELGEGLFPVGGGVSLDEAGVSCSFVGGFPASVRRWAARLSSMSQMASHKSLTAASSLGKCPRFLVILRSW